MTPRRPIVMIIDGDAPSRRAINRALRATCLVVAAADPREALHRFDEGEQIDAILCDLDFFEMSGSEFYRALYARDARLASRTVFMTGNAALPPAVGNPLIGKPFFPDALRSVVNDLLEGFHAPA